MNEGINLASRPIRRRGFLLGLAGMGVLLACVLSGAHALSWLAAGREVAEARIELESLAARRAELIEQVEGSRRRLTAPSSLGVLRQLEAIEESGASRAVSPVELLMELATALPAEAKTLSIRLNLAPPDPELRMEAEAGSPAAAAALLSGLSGSRLVQSVEITEERHLSAGRIHLRILAPLASGGGER